MSDSILLVVLQVQSTPGSINKVLTTIEVSCYAGLIGHGAFIYLGEEMLIHFRIIMASS